MQRGIENLSHPVAVSTETVGQQMVTVAELSHRLHVSTKTISRWKRWGLVSRRFVRDGRNRVGYLESSVDRFVAQNADRVRRGAKFSHLSDAEREMIIDRAQRWIRTGTRPPDLIRRLAERTSRSRETIRYILKQFDRQHPNVAILFGNRQPLAEETKRQIYQEHRRGESLDALAQRFGRTRAGVRRTISEMRAQWIQELPLSYIPNPLFAKILGSRKLEMRVLSSPPPPDEPCHKAPRPAGLPPYLASLYDMPLLTRAQEAHLFRKLNYLKYKAAQLRKELDPTHPKSNAMDLVEKCYDEAVAVKNQIVRANLRLVVSIAKRHVGPLENFFELVSDGNMSLMRAVEKFDFGRGFKFSTYASWAIMKNFARTIPYEHRRRDRFRSTPVERFTSTEDLRSDQYARESSQVQQRSLVTSILGRLDEREQQIVIRRFGLQRGREPLTLKQVGAELGVTKERIRQIEVRALGKLRKAVRESHGELPG